MTALREYVKVKDGMIQVKIPDDFKSDEVEVIIMPKANPIKELDPYFKERKEQLSKTLQDIESGKMKIYSNDEFEREMDKFEQELIVKYAD